VFLISHRGNTHGSVKKEENNPYFLDKLLKTCYNIEVDVWLLDNKLYLGHDIPQYEVTLEFLKNDLLWCHAKNLDALQYMLDHKIHCFWHQSDDFTITSRGYIWTFPNKDVTKNSVIVCHTKEETEYYSKMDIAGVCSDFVGDLN
jgi:hypothetical protein